MFGRKMYIAVKALFLVLVLALEKGDAYPSYMPEGPKVCYPTDEKSCFSPDYYIHWTGAYCEYGLRGGPGECWPWLTWWMFWIYFATGLTVGFGFLGCLCGPLCGTDIKSGGVAGCFTGYCLLCPCIAIPCFLSLCISKIRCELCGMKFKSCDLKDLRRDRSHREVCLENNGSEFDSISASSIYKCKKCQTNLKVWPIEKLAKSKCLKCNNEIVNNGINLHICFTCANTGWSNSHHLCGHHGRQGAITEVDFEDLANLPTAHAGDTQPMPGSQYNNVLPPGWQLLTNPVTGVPYGLCDPSGEIKPLVDSKVSDNSIPPPYEEAVAYPAEEPIPVVTTYNGKLNMERANLKKPQRIMRQSSIEMNSIAERFRGIHEQSMLPYPTQFSDQEAYPAINPGAHPHPI